MPAGIQEDMDGAAPVAAPRTRCIPIDRRTLSSTRNCVPPGRVTVPAVLAAVPAPAPMITRLSAVAMIAASMWQFAERSMSPRDKRAHEQFARDYAEQIHFVRDALGASPAPGAVT